MSRSGSGPELLAVHVCGAIGLAMALLTVPDSVDFSLDDAWIHLSYAKSLALGEGLSYNPGDQETGCSSPLWALLLALWPMGTDPVLAVKLLGTLLHGATAWLSARLALELLRARATPARPLPLLTGVAMAGVLVATHPSLVQASTSGMEVSLASALLLATAIAHLRGLALPAATLAAASTWTRPEALLFCTLVGFGSWLATPRARRRAEVLTALAPMLGSWAALAAWVGYCLAVTGQPWPNAQYVKGVGGGWSGLSYLIDEVLPHQPWLISVTGAVALGYGMVLEVRARRWDAAILLAASISTWIAIATTRPLHPGVLFYESRYFSVVAAFPALLVALGLIGLKPWITALALGPIALLTGIQSLDLDQLRRAQERNTRRLHTEPALYLAEHLPADAVVAVEGAGAPRYLTPRTMTVVDVVGLNDHRAARLHFDRQAKLCHLVSRAPDHFLIPSHWVGEFVPAFAFEPVAAFDEPDYRQVMPPRAARVELLRVVGLAPRFAGCADHLAVVGSATDPP